MSHTLTGADIRAWRKTARLDQEQLARKLGVAREWLSKIENAKAPVSAEIYLAFEKAKREANITSGSRDSGGSDGAKVVTEEMQAAYGTPETLRREIVAFIDSTIKAAGEDMAKLGWIREQLIRHCSAPEHWATLARVIAEQKDAEDEKDRKALEEVERTHSPAAHGKAV